MNRIPIIIQGSGGIINNLGDPATKYGLKYDEVTDELILEKDGVEDNRINITPIGGNSSELQNDLNVSKDIGGVESGTDYAKGTSIETILRDMLNPVENPILTNPSATLRILGNTIYETGSTANVTIELSLDRGKISPSYGTSGYRSGEAISYILNGAEQTNSSFSVVVSESNNQFSGVIKYAKGEQPKDSKGNNYGSPLPAGQISTNSVTCEFVNCIWSNASNISNIAKENLISKSAKSKVFEFPSQTVSEVETFDIPADWEVTGIQVLNQLNNRYEDCASEFTVSDVTHGSVRYKRYSDNRGYEAGPRSIKVSWK